MSFFNRPVLHKRVNFYSVVIPLIVLFLSALTFALVCKNTTTTADFSFDFHNLLTAALYLGTCFSSIFSMFYFTLYKRSRRSWLVRHDTGFPSASFNEQPVGTAAAPGGFANVSGSPPPSPSVQYVVEVVETSLISVPILARVDVAVPCLDDVDSETLLTVRSWWPSDQGISTEVITTRAGEVAVEHAENWLEDKITKANTMPKTAEAVRDVLEATCSEENSARFECSCSICLDDTSATPSSENEDKLYSLPCKHNFHLSCLTGWYLVAEKLHCPLCRDDLLNTYGKMVQQKGRFTVEERADMLSKIKVRNIHIFPNGNETGPYDF